jgi:hypothetical protein
VTDPEELAEVKVAAGKVMETTLTAIDAEARQRAEG